MKEFIVADLQKTLNNMKAPVQTPPAQSSEVALVNLNKTLKEVENLAIRLNGLEPVDTASLILSPSPIKGFIKRVIRKLCFWIIRPYIVDQSRRNELYTDITNELRECLYLIKDTLGFIQKDMPERRINGFGFDDGSSIFEYVDYEAFENAFRGSTEEIKSRLSRYVSRFEPGESFLDLGCGRGEFLELLRDSGLKVKGVDITRSFVEECRRKGLSADCGDMYEYLEKLPDESFDGISAIQVIEHITPVQLAKLSSLCFKKLKKDGRLILETQNPMVLSTMTSYFYVDPTHIRPVHPSWLKYLLQSAGFQDVELDFPEYAWVLDGSIPHLSGEFAEKEVLNSKIDYLNNLLYGSTDYAAIATK